jgi:hypothetical protein
MKEMLLADNAKQNFQFLKTCNKYTMYINCSSWIAKTIILKTLRHLKFSEALENIALHQCFKVKPHSLSKHINTHWIVQVGL